MEDAMMAPVEDLNIVQEEIPEVLEKITKVYDVPSGMSCTDIGKAVESLTVVLGPDDDVPPPPEKDRTEKIEDGATSLTYKTMEDATTSVIPFRGIVRMITGASAHQEKVRTAYEMGLLRRAYLKGLGEAKGCTPPAAPQ